MKKIFTGILCLALCAGCLVGCGDKVREQPPMSVDEDIEKSEAADLKETDVKAEEDTNVSSYDLNAKVSEDGSDADSSATTGEITSEELKEVYLDFLKGDSKMTVATSDFEALETDKEYSYEDMNLCSLKYFEEQFDSAELTDADYAFIDCGADNVPELAVWQKYLLSMDAAYTYFVFKYLDGKVCLVSSFYGYYRMYADINNYGYITYGGSNGASSCGFDYSFIDKDGKEIFLYSENDDTGFAEAYIPKYYFPKGKDFEEYPDELYSDGDEHISCLTYNFDKYDYENSDDYNKHNFYSFVDMDGKYVEPSEEFAGIFEKAGIKYYEPDEAKRLIDEHEKSLGVTDQIKSDAEVSWMSLLSIGVGEYDVKISSRDTIMHVIPGNWKLNNSSVKDGVKDLYLAVETNGEFKFDINYSDEYKAPAYAKGHIVLSETDYYDPIFYFYVESGNCLESTDNPYVGPFYIDEFLKDSKNVTMTISCGNESFLDECMQADGAVFEKAFSDDDNDKYKIVYNPSDEYYNNTYDTIPGAKKVKPVELKQRSCTENEITDEDVWFEKVGMQWNRDTYSDDKYTYRISGTEGFGRRTMLYVYDKGSEELVGAYDFHDFIWADGYVNNSYVDRGIHYAIIKDNVLYVNLYHNTYAETCPYNAYVVAVDMNDGGVFWKTKPLVSNSDNFVIIGDNLITGYGFSAEDHYLSVIDRFTGEVLRKDTIKKSPDYFFLKDNVLYVRTYSYDYEFEVTDTN